jgi:metal-responsive CopG/Arc/MetJ family transcriptional regulator
MPDNIERINVSIDSETLARVDTLVTVSRKTQGIRNRSQLIVSLINDEWDKYLANHGFTCTECCEVLPITTDLISVRNVEVKCNKCGSINKR